MALIPARAGSKSIPGKNYKLFAGKPLIEHSIEFALSLEDISEVYITSNDSKIKDIAANFSNVNFIERPERLAQDDSAMVDVIRHSIEMVTSEGKEFDFLVLLDPTSPIRASSLVSEAIGMLNLDSNLDGIVAISNPHFNPFWVGVSLNTEKHVKRIFPEYGQVTRRQEARSFSRINGSFYCWRFEFSRKLPIDYLTNGNIGEIMVPEETAISIDTPGEWKVAEMMFQEFSKNQKRNR
jgi:N-acylneuraminate cytidylyltransferase